MRRWFTRPGMRQWLGGALLLVLVPGLVTSLVLQFRSIERRQASELQSDLEVARAVGTAFEAYVQDVLHQEQIGRASCRERV